MRNVWRLFRYDLAHLGANVITLVIVLGLVFLPSIFTWYNVIACWDVFGNTGNLKVAVANADEGYQSDLVPLTVNVGDQVESALRANDQLKWVFTSEEDAIDGAKSGEYYAAVVIPADFSRDMMSFAAADGEHAQIVYYTNEKKNAVAPRVTDQGADQVATQINQTFTQTLSDVALALASSIGTYAEQGDAGGHIAKLAGGIADAGAQMNDAANVLDSYTQLTQTASGLVDSSAALLGQARDAVGAAGDAVAGGVSGAQDVAGALQDSTASLSSALDASAAGFGGVGASIDQVYADAGTSAADAAGALRAKAGDVDTQVSRYQEVAAQIEALKPSLPDAFQSAADAALGQVNAVVNTLIGLRDSLNGAADAVEQGNADAQAQRADVQAKADAARTGIDALKADFDQNLKPGLDGLASTAAAAASTLVDRASLLDGASADLQTAAGSVAAKLTDAQGRIGDAAANLRDSAGVLTAFSQRIDEALASGNIDQLKAVVGGDPQALAQALSAPVGVERIPVFAVEDFGSAMAPLYSTLALWVGALLTLVLLNPKVSDRARAQLDRPRSWQLFFGRYGAAAVVLLAQSTVACLGNMLFLHVQVDNPFFYLLSFWCASLVFGFIVYTLVSLFANLGKALAVLLLILQVSAGGGSYPLQVLPDFFQAASPLLPATHAIGAMRAAMMGSYANDFWLQLGALMLFTVPFIVLGLLRPILVKATDWFVEHVEASKLVS